MSPDPSREPLKDQKTIKVTSVGDLMCRRDLLGVGGEGLYEHVGKRLFSGDLRLGNLEFSINNEWLIEKLLRYSVPPSFAEPLIEDKRYGRYDCLFLSNNHINDSLSGGIKSTCKYLDEIGMKHVGANISREAQDQFPIIDVQGIKVAVLSYTFTTNGIPLEDDFTFGTNVIKFNSLKDEDYDPSLIHHHIELAKKRGADFIISSHHWGVEYEYYPSERLVKRAHALLDQGIDLIIGHHPHILNLSERYKTRDGREAFVLYSLGNLTAFGLLLPIQKLGAVAEIELETGIDSNQKKIVRIGKVTIMPTLHSRNKKNGTVYHKLVPILSFAEKIRTEKSVPSLSFKDKRAILKLEKEFRKYLNQKGIEYI